MTPNAFFRLFISSSLVKYMPRIKLDFKKKKTTYFGHKTETVEIEIRSHFLLLLGNPTVPYIVSHQYILKN